MPEVVVLGPTGSIGSHLLQLLHAQDIGVRTGNRRDFDYFSPRTYDPLFRGATHLFLLTPVVDSMVELTAALLVAAKRAGIERVVKISALGAMTHSPARLLRWHGEGEDLVAASGIAWVNLRPNALMQNFIQHYAPAIRAASRVAIPAGDSLISFVDAKDVARVAYHALFDNKFDGVTLDLTGPRAIGFSEAVSTLTFAAGRPIQYLDVSEEAARRAMGQRQIPDWKIEALIELYASYRRGEAAHVMSTVRDFTGEAPGTFKSFIGQHVKEFQ